MDVSSLFSNTIIVQGIEAYIHTYIHTYIHYDILYSVHYLHVLPLGLLLVADHQLMAYLMKTVEFVSLPESKSPNITLMYHNDTRHVFHSKMCVPRNKWYILN